jgi:hypothetical protein
MQYGEGGRTHEMLEYLRDSYLDHIEGHDIDYGLYLNERGIL